MTSYDANLGEVTGQVNFGSHTDSVVAVAAAVVNVVTPGCRQGRDYEAPAGRTLLEQLDVAIRTGSRKPSDAPRASTAAAFVELGTAVRPVFDLVSADNLDAAATTVNALLKVYQPNPYLDHHDGQPWHLHFHGRSEHDRSGWGGGIVVGLATVLGSEHADRLGVCAAPSCDRVYVDVSKNGTRRFCSTACQNRVKAAAHRARAVSG